jgi:hypothetical protein
MEGARNVRKQKTRIALFLLLGILLRASLTAQQASDQKTPAASAQKTPAPNDQTPPPESEQNPTLSEPANRPPSLGVSVDSARKSPDLPTSVTTENNSGATWGLYEVKQAAELGGRISDFTGSTAMWDTLVNLGSGPRLLEYTLNMRSPAHNGKLFDELNFSNFGYGGDPNDVSHLLISKGAAYNFAFNFRRDQQVFDYNLLANPLNPPTSNPNVPILQTPHEFLTVRRMTDATLRLLPVGRVRFQLGWSQVVNNGQVASTVHEGNEGQLIIPAETTTETIHFGVMFHLLPRTSFNYDQFYTYYKGDNFADFANAQQQAVFGIPTFTLPGGTPVNLGLSFNTPAGYPCATPVLGTGFANPACNGFFSYFRSDRVRNNYPTEQATFQSSYFRWLDISGRFSYTGSESNLPNAAETFSGLITRTRQVATSQTGSASSQRINVAADLGFTVRLTNRLRLIDTFRLDNFRIPGLWALTTTSLFGATLLTTPNAFSLATCPPPFTATSCPQHIASSGPDIDVNLLNQFLRQDMWTNTVELEYDFTRRIMGYIGFNYMSRDITDNFTNDQLETFFPTLPNRGACAGQPVVNGVCTVFVPGTVSGLSDNTFVPINAYTALIGFSARPTDNLRFSFDTDLYWADNTFTRIAPRKSQWYKGKLTYTPTNWMSFNGGVNILEASNTADTINNHQHNRSYAISTVFAPPQGKWGVDFSYTYNDIFSQINICFVATPTPPGSLSCGTPFLSGISNYSELANIVNASVYLHPVSRVNLGAGYTLTSTTGNTLILNPNAPTGPLSYNYHLPSALLSVELTKHLIYKTSWNYYDYNEKSQPGPTLPRDFRGNTFTLSLRYLM